MCPCLLITPLLPFFVSRRVVCFTRSPPSPFLALSRSPGQHLLQLARGHRGGPACRGVGGVQKLEQYRVSGVSAAHRTLPLRLGSRDHPPRWHALSCASPVSVIDSSLFSFLPSWSSYIKKSLQQAGLPTAVQAYRRDGTEVSLSLECMVHCATRATTLRPMSCRSHPPPHWTLTETWNHGIPSSPSSLHRPPIPPHGPIPLSHPTCSQHTGINTYARLNAPRTTGSEVVILCAPRYSRQDRMDNVRGVATLLVLAKHFQSECVRRGFPSLL